jgi:hypothetical protein
MPLLLKLFLLIIGIAYPFRESTLGILPLGTPHGCVGLQVAPGVITFILRTSFWHFFDKGRVIRPALAAGGYEGAESRLLTTGAFDQDVRWTSPVDLAHLHVLNLVVRLDALDYRRHWHLSLSPVAPSSWCAAEYVNIEAWGAHVCAL